MSDPKGEPGCLRESVDRVPIVAREMSVRARSAWLGSGSCVTGGPLDACCRGAVILLNDINFFTFDYGNEKTRVAITRHSM